MKITLSLFFSLFSFVLFAQSDSVNVYPIAPDNRAIEVAINNEQSPYFYPKLFTRYIEGDTTLNLDDYRHLYYGYAFQDSYNPLQINTYSDSVIMVLERNKDELIAPELFDEIIYYSDKVLSVAPFGLNFINLMTFCYQMSGNYEMAERYSYKLQMIQRAIFSSGNGVKKDSPWHILYREDANDIMGLMGLSYYKRMYITTKVEYFQLVGRNEEGTRGYYFDIERLLWKPVEFKKSRKMEVNPYQNPKSNRFISPQKLY